MPESASKGNRKTVRPPEADRAPAGDRGAQAGASRGAANIGRAVAAAARGRGGAPIAIYNDVLHDPKMRDPRGSNPVGSRSIPYATKFVNTLIKAGVVAHRATAPFTLAGKQYPAGSFVFKAAQAFRAHLMDMFEPQDHPDDIPYPGGPPRPPYDVTGYNIAYSMGVKFDRILEGFDGPFRSFQTSSPDAAGRAHSPAAADSAEHEVTTSSVAVNR